MGAWHAVPLCVFALRSLPISTTAIIIVKGTKNTKWVNGFLGNSKRPVNILWPILLWRRMNVTDVETEVRDAFRRPHESGQCSYSCESKKKAKKKNKTKPGNHLHFHQ